MPTYNYKSRELIAKIVYYGPGRCGKTTNLQQIHSRMRPETRSELLSVATETDRTIYFDLLPLNLGTISGMKFMVRLFTVPGQVYYAETRKLVLKGTDGIVFVADSQDHMMDENRQSLRDLQENLGANGLEYDSIPLVMQWNKRDLPHLISEAELEAALNIRKVKALSAIASQGDGVLETLRYITLAVFNHIKSGGKPKKPASQPAATAAAPQPATGPQRAAVKPRPTSAPAVGNVKPGSWSAALPKTSLDTKEADEPLAHPAAKPVTNRAPVAAPPRPASSPPKKDGPQPVKISGDLVLDEFKNLAVMQSQFEERLTALENEISRLTHENQEIREMLSRQSH
jgi:signal recognition particle receptor subunit beta